MAWTKLPTDYTDAIWNGNRKYKMITNSDGTVSFEDVTEYTNKEKSFFGATEANQMNAGMNELAENMENVEASKEAAATSATNAANSASAAASSASSASSSKTSAASSASSASDSASTASTKATEAATSATNAATSATNAANSATEAADSADVAKTLLYTGAGAHNAIYRGKYLGTAVTDEQYAAISAGTFEDLYIGDYWTINGVNWRIAAFDYYYNCGDTQCKTHHAVIVPDTCLYTAQMNTSNTTSGGYVGSAMYTANLANAKETIKAAFSGHVLSHRIYLTNATSNGYASAGAWCDSEVDLMNEQMVCGTGIFSPVSTGSAVPANYRVEKSQLPLFALEPSRICNRATWWLRDVITASRFAVVYASGYATCGNASGSNGVRPVFLLS